MTAWAASPARLALHRSRRNRAPARRIAGRSCWSATRAIAVVWAYPAGRRRSPRPPRSSSRRRRTATPRGAGSPRRGVAVGGGDPRRRRRRRVTWARPTSGRRSSSPSPRARVADPGSEAPGAHGVGERPRRGAASRSECGERCGRRPVRATRARRSRRRRAGAAQPRPPGRRREPVRRARSARPRTARGRGGKPPSAAPRKLRPQVISVHAGAHAAMCRSCGYRSASRAVRNSARRYSAPLDGQGVQTPDNGAATRAGGRTVARGGVPPREGRKTHGGTLRLSPEHLVRLRERQEGQTMAEYALILGLIAIVVILASCSSAGRSRTLPGTGSSVTNSVS